MFFELDLNELNLTNPANSLGSVGTQVDAEQGSGHVRRRSPEMFHPWEESAIDLKMTSFSGPVMTHDSILSTAGSSD
jgi:hypothetical protein